MTNKAGGPAFPQYSFSNHGVYVDGGMTIRDYFAAKAMHAYASTDQWARTPAQNIAAISYAMADAMLEARK